MKPPKYLHTLTHYEYWPWWVLYLPLLPLLLWYVVRSRSIFFYKKANPGLYNGGFQGERKQDLLPYLPKVYAPQTQVVDADWPLDGAEACLKEIGLPVVAKPDVGERGTGVEKLDTPEAWRAYHQRQNGPYLLQQYVTLATELGVFYSRHPREQRGMLSSVTGKRYMQVTGDGHSTVLQLMARVPRYRYQLKRMATQQPELAFSIPSKDETLLLEPIGNHCRGTEFTNRNDLCHHPLLLEAVEQVARSIPGFYYGRLDVKVQGLAGEAPFELKVLEVNGVASEPGHIYAQGYGLLSAYRDVFWHLRRMWTIARAVKKQQKSTLSLQKSFSNATATS